ncbi:MAG: hypothetical protein QW156_01450 [Candidatus Aenigmatarchaeota archaeon]
MSSDAKLINISVNENIEKISRVQEDFSFFVNFDLITLKILQKFYGNAIDPINGNLNSFCTQQLHQLLNKEGLKISLEGLRKKLDFLVKIHFLEKVETYPRIYMPVKDIEGIRKIQSKIERLKELIFL